LYHLAVAGLTLDNARELLESWARSTSWRRRGLAQKLEITSFDEKSAYTVRLETHVEARRIADHHRPYLGRPLDGPGDKPEEAADSELSLPTAEVKHPGDFVADIQDFAVPHTEVVRPCDQCKSTGRETCQSCRGEGLATCTTCWGRGQTTRDGTSSSCHDCNGSGKSRCSYCDGGGGVKCTACLGHLKLVHFDQLIVHFQSRTDERVIGETALPSSLVGHASTTTAYHEEGPRLEPIAGHGGGGPFRGSHGRVNHQVNAAVNELIEGERLADGEKIIKQRLSVESLPVYEATYRWGNGLRHCWIYGHGLTVHAPDYPVSRLRITGTVVAAMALLAATYGKFVGLY